MSIFMFSLEISLATTSSEPILKADACLCFAVSLLTDSNVGVFQVLHLVIRRTHSLNTFFKQ